MMMSAEWFLSSSLSPNKRNYVTICQLIVSLHCLLFVETSPSGYDSSYVFLEVRNRRNEATRTICANYQQFSRNRISASPEESEPLSVAWWGGRVRNYNVCAFTQASNLSGHVVPSLYRMSTTAVNKCPGFPSNWTQRFPYVVERIQETGASAALFLLRRGQAFYTQFDDYLFADFRDPFLGKNKSRTVNVSVFYTYISRFNEEVLSLSETQDYSDLELRFYRPHSFEVDGAMLVIFLLSVFSVGMGGWWSGKYRLLLWEEETAAVEKKRLAVLEKQSEPAVSGGVAEEPLEAVRSQKRKEEEREPSAAPFSCLTVVIFVAVIVGMLLLLYYFYGVFVWFIIVMFTVASCLAAYSCLSALLDPIGCGKCRVGWSLADCYSRLSGKGLGGACRCCREKPMFRNVLLFLLCAAFSISWCIFRKWAFSFILQDILSVFFCVHLIKTLRVPSLKWLSILLGALLVYDLFMVFITPYFTKDGCSVMVEVATGGGCDQGDDSYPRPPQLKEQLPIIFRVPRVTDPVLSCYDLSVDLQYPPMMLGLGDVILPGLLIGFCFAMDFIWKVKYHIYGVVSVCSYGLGMIFTFGALMLMKRAQPALIYLVPITLLPVIITAKARKQLGILWRGDMPIPEDHRPDCHISESGIPKLTDYNTINSPAHNGVVSDSVASIN